MLTQQRKSLILRLLKEEGQVVAKAVSRTLGLSEDTIRRDLRELASEGLLQRVHGGALPVSPALAGFAERQTVASSEKTRIGKVAARMVRPGQTVFLDGGTTAVQLARHLPHDLEATVITHSPSVAVELVSNPCVTVELVGGRLFKHSIVTVGAAAIEMIGRFRPEIFFMGVTGLHHDIGLTTGDAEEAAMKRTLSRLSAETVVLASSEKLGAASPHLVLHLAEVDAIVVDGPMPDELNGKIDDLGIAIITS